MEKKKNLNKILKIYQKLDKSWWLKNKVLKEKIKFNKKYLYTSLSDTLLVNSHNLTNITP